MNIKSALIPTTGQPQNIPLLLILFCFFFFCFLLLPIPSHSIAFRLRFEPFFYRAVIFLILAFACVFRLLFFFPSSLTHFSSLGSFVSCIINSVLNVCFFFLPLSYVLPFIPCSFRNFDVHGAEYKLFRFIANMFSP